MLGGLYRVPTQHSPRIPIFSIFKAKGPTYGQMKAILEVSQIWPQIDLRLTLELTLELTQNDPPETIPRLVPRLPSDPHIRTSDIPMVQNGHYLRFY